MSWDSTSQVFSILPRRGRIAWVSRLRACLALPPAESPSTRKSSLMAGSWPEQSASLPGSAGPEVTFLRATFFALFWRRWAALITSSARASAWSTWWLSHSEKASLTTPETKPATVREESRSLVWPANWGSSIFTEST